jgi:hypothetical protein
MKHLKMVLIFLLLGGGVIGWPAAGQLTAYQDVPSPAAVGESVMVTVTLTYNGANSMRAEVMPSSNPAGVVIGALGGLSADLGPGDTAPISYSIRAERGGTYWIESQITYSEDGARRMLRLESPFMAMGPAEPEREPQPSPQPQPLPGPGVRSPGGEPGADEPPVDDSQSPPPAPEQPVNGTPPGEMPP